MPRSVTVVRCGKFEVRIWASNAVTEVLNDLLGGLLRRPSEGGAAVVAWELSERCGAALVGTDAASRFVLRRDNVDVARSSDLGVVAELLFWHLTHEAIDGLTRSAGLHAGAVSRSQQVVVLPAPSGSGKTTLTAALVSAGWDYLSDELAVVERSGSAVQPFARPLSMSREAIGLIPGLGDRVPTELDSDRCTKLQVRPDLLRPGALGSPGSLGAVIFPRYEPGAETHVEPLRRVDALVGLLPNTFNLTRDGGGQPLLDTLAALCRRAPGYRLVTGNLDEAVVAVEEIAAL